MKDSQCVHFLQWALPQMRMRWSGFRKVRSQVCKRIDRRIRDLGLADIDEYRRYLTTHADEWQHLDALCHITISRFYRDKGVFEVLAEQVLPTLSEEASIRGDGMLRIWSVGCASGEEPYTLAILWTIEFQQRFPDTAIDIVATDADPNMLRRAQAAQYEFGSLKDLPVGWREQAFTLGNGNYVLKREYKDRVQFFQQDVREAQPDGPFDLILCRNLVFTYYDETLQSALLTRIVANMRHGASLVLGVHERLPEDAAGVSPWFDDQSIYRLIEN